MLKVFPFKQPRPGTQEAIEAIEKAFASGKRFVMLDAPTGCHSKGTKVIMYDGTLKKVEDVKIGDLLIGPDSKPRKVQRLYNGIDDMYQITPNKGKPFVVNKDHILSIKTDIGSSQKVINISVKEYLEKASKTSVLKNYKLYKVPLEFESQKNNLKIPPYFLGLVLGDSCFSQANTIDKTYRQTKCKKLLQNKDFKKLNLLNKIWQDKSIPLKYKVSSRFNRLELLAGLIDSSGLWKKQGFEITQKSKQLSEDILFLSRSLGLSAILFPKKIKDSNSWKIIISGNCSILPLRLINEKRHKAYAKKNSLNSRFKISFQGKGEYFGFSLDKDHLYLLEDFTVTHNSGKSGIAVAYSRKYKTTIWTPTKFLQSQYSNTQEFLYEYSIFGKSNYKCGLPGQDNTSVDSAICCSSKIVDENRAIIPFPLSSGKDKLSKELRNICGEKGICPYYSKISKISKVPGATINYDLGLRIKKQAGQNYFGIDMGEAVVLDEAHQLIQKATSIFGYQLTNTGAMKLFGNEGKRGKNEGPLTWFNRLSTIVAERIALESDGKKVARFIAFQQRINGILEFNIDDEKRFYIDDRKLEVEIKPLDLRYFKAKLFYPFKKILMLSATFPSNFTKVLGINEDEVARIRINSTFKAKNRRAIFASDIENMNARTILTPESDQIKMLQYILKAHENDKGIVHCGNYKFFDQLKGLMKHDKRFIWVDKTKNKDEMFYLHQKSKKPTVLVSPAMLEGVDLKDDLARFGVMLKIPYPPLDEYTKRMSRIFPQWYENLTITNIVQAYGRQVRNDNDHAIFYIIDGAFKMILNRNKNLIPPYFAEALKVGDKGRLVKILMRKVEEGKLK